MYIFMLSLQPQPYGPGHPQSAASAPPLVTLMIAISRRNFSSDEFTFTLLVMTYKTLCCYFITFFAVLTEF